MGPNGEEFDGLAILTTPSVRRYKPITDRLPLIIPPEDFDAWLNVRSGRFDEARPLLKSPAPEELVAYAVSDRVNSRINDDASLTEPVIAHQDEAAKKLRPSEHEELPAKEETQHRLCSSNSTFSKSNGTHSGLGARGCPSWIRQKRSAPNTKRPKRRISWAQKL